MLIRPLCIVIFQNQNNDAGYYLCSDYSIVLENFTCSKRIEALNMITESRF